MLRLVRVTGESVRGLPFLWLSRLNASPLACAVVNLTRLYIEPKPELPESMRGVHPRVLDLDHGTARSRAYELQRQGYDVICVEL